MTMNWNRNHYMTIGFLMVFCGFHFRVVESFVLTPQATKFLNEQHDGLELTGNVYSDQNGQNAANRGNSIFPQYQTASQQGGQAWTTAGFTRSSTVTEETKKVITPPNWTGWPMIYVGAVLALFGLTMPRSN